MGKQKIAVGGWHFFTSEVKCPERESERRWGGRGTEGAMEEGRGRERQREMEREREGGRAKASAQARARARARVRDRALGSSVLYRLY